MNQYNKFLEQIIDEGDKRLPSLLSNYIKENKELHITPIDTLILSFNEYLNHPKSKIRSIATKTLYLLIEYRKEKLTSIQISHLIDIFDSKLSDVTCASQAIYGIDFLFKNYFIPFEHMINSTKKLLQITISLFNQPNRAFVFDLIIFLLSNHFNIIKFISEELVEGIISLIDGEKDPRCLIKAFWIYKVVMNEVNDNIIEEHLFDLFEIISCYFPITYTPVEDIQITEKELESCLRKCFISNDLLSQYLIPFLIEKIRSTIIIPYKVDCAKMIYLAFKHFNFSYTVKFVDKMWNFIYLEIINETEEEVIHEFLKLVKIITFNIYASSSVIMKELNEKNNFVRHLKRDCFSEVMKADSGRRNVCKRIMLSSAKSTVKAFMNIFQDFWDQTKNHFFLQKLTPLHIAFLFEITLDLINLMNNYSKQSSQDFDRFLNYNIKELFEIFSSALIGGVSNQRAIGIAALTSISLLRYSLSNTNVICLYEIKNIIKHISNTIITDEATNVRIQCAKSLCSLSIDYSTHIISITLPIISNSILLINENTILNNLVNVNEKYPHNEQLLLFDLYTDLSSVNGILFTEIVDKMIRLVNEHYKKLLSNNEFSMKLIINLMNSLNKITLKLRGNKSIKLNEYKNIINIFIHLFDCLLNIFFLQYFPSIFSKEIKSNIIHDYISDIIFNGCLVLDEISDREIIVNKFIDFFNRGEYWMNKEKLKFPCLFSLVKPNIMIDCYLFLVRFVIVKKWDFSAYHLINNLIKLILTYEGEIHSNYFRLISNLVNKIKDKKIIDLLIKEHIKDKILIIINDTKSTKKMKIRLCLLFLWITKAFIIKTHPKSEYFSDTIISLLNNDDEIISNVITENYDILLKEDQYICKECHNIISPIFKQYIISITFEKFINNYEITHKYNLLISISYLIINVPIDMLTKYNKDIINIFSKDIFNNNSKSLVPIFEAYTKIILSNPLIIKDNVQTIITILIKMSSFEKKDLRITSLKCFNTLLTIPVDLIIRYQERVVMSLEKLLDDRKRNIRRLAAVCINKWIMIKK